MKKIKFKIKTCCHGYLGIKALASSALSGHKLAICANSNLCNFFCIRRL